MADSVVSFRDNVEKARQEKVAPLQRDVLEKVRVAKLGELIGDEFAEKMERAWDDPSKRPNMLCTNTLENTVGTSVVRLVETGYRQHIVRKTLLHPELEQIEVWRYPSRSGDVTKLLTILEYEHFLVRCPASRLTADLMELVVPEGKAMSTTAAVLGGFNSASGKDVVISETSVDRSTGKVSLSPKWMRKLMPHLLVGNLMNSMRLIFLHEIGHTYQTTTNEFVDLLLEVRREESDYLRNTPNKAPFILLVEAFLKTFKFPDTSTAQKRRAFFAVAERNASAFLLAAVRTYRQKGLDIAPDISNATLIRYVNRWLSTRGEDKKLGAIQFSKVRKDFLDPGKGS